MQMAYDATAYQEAEDRAWLLTQVAHLYFVNGDLAKSEKDARGALEIFPNYHYALGALAEVRLQQNRNDEAAELFQRRYAAAPHAENLFSLAEALERSGRREEAAKAFKEFEEKSLLESRIADNSNHELIAYYLDYAKKPADALKLAEAELTRRHDVYTLACYAWSLAANGETARAEVEMKKVLAVGVRDPKILRHAQTITVM